MVEECIVCLTRHPKPDRVCIHCENPACEWCNLEYIMSRPELPHCMNCRREFSRPFLVEMLGMQTVNTKIKKHIEEVLYDSEKSKLPQFLIELNEKRSRKAYERKVDYFNKYVMGSVTTIRQELFSLQNSLNTIKTISDRQLNASKNQYIKTLEGAIEYFNLPQNSKILSSLWYDLGDDNISHLENQSVIHCCCPVKECRGYISNNWKCLSCNIKVCKKCREIKKKKKDGGHECDETIIENVNAILKDTKSCPTCHVPIFRIEGCNQIFCTSCCTGFDWKTLTKIKTTILHNPHYFEWLKRTGGKTNEDIVDPCSRNGRLRALMGKHPFHATGLLESLNYIESFKIMSTDKCKTQFLDNKIDEEVFKISLQRIYKANMKTREWIQVIETLVDIGTDILQRYGSSSYQIIEFKDYIQEQLMNISKIYNCKLIKVQDNLAVL